GEKRTYELAPLSFQIQIVGGLTIKDPTQTEVAVENRDDWFHLDGAFLLRLDREGFQVFATAGASIDPLGIKGRVVGLVIARGPPEDGGIPGIAGLFQLEITVGKAPESGTDTGGLEVVPGVFSLTGRVEV